MNILSSFGIEFIKPENPQIFWGKIRIFFITPGGFAGVRVRTNDIQNLPAYSGGG